MGKCGHPGLQFWLAVRYRYRYRCSIHFLAVMTLAVWFSTVSMLIIGLDVLLSIGVQKYAENSGARSCVLASSVCQGSCIS